MEATPVIAAERTVDWDRVAADLAPIACDRSVDAVKRKSRDYFWFSPILKALLDPMVADIIVTPASLEELERVVAYCATRRLPVTIRGGGTGNYGQAMPLSGGVVLDLTRMNGVLWVRGDAIRAQAGAKLFAMEQVAQTSGRELRFHPSTWKLATVGGFLAGGTTGCGAINFGTIHSPDNVLAIRVMTMEQAPRLLELRGADAQVAVHAYGTNGIIVEVELALAPAPARVWHDRIVALPDLASALELIDRLARDNAIGKKELALLDAASVALIRPLEGVAPPDHVLVLAMIDEATLDVADAVIEASVGYTVFARGPGAPRTRVPALYELCWNHTTMHAIARDSSISYLQLGLPFDYIPTVIALAAELGEETPMHLELAKVDGTLVCYGLPLLRYTDAARLDAIHAVYRRHGCTVFNPHTYLLENGGMQIADPAQASFRRTSDPLGLLNPGKMPGWDLPPPPDSA